MHRFDDPRYVWAEKFVLKNWVKSAIDPPTVAIIDLFFVSWSNPDKWCVDWNDNCFLSFFLANPIADDFGPPHPEVARPKEMRKLLIEVDPSRIPGLCQNGKQQGTGA